VKTGDFGFFERPKVVKPKVGVRCCKPGGLLVVEVDLLKMTLKTLIDAMPVPTRRIFGGILYLRDE